VPVAFKIFLRYDDNPNGIYIALVRAKAYFRTGYTRV
jgi:hypothetical protein